MIPKEIIFDNEKYPFTQICTNSFDNAKRLCVKGYFS